MIRFIRDDSNAVLTLSAPIPGFEALEGVCLSLPRVLGARGIKATLRPELSPEEAAAIRRSALVLKEAAGEIGYH